MKQTVLITVLLTLSLWGASCIFQNDPAGPDTSPKLESYYPLTNIINLVVPDSCLFKFKAIDPDRDYLNYKFTLGDSLLCSEEEFTFYARDEGTYEVSAVAYNKSGSCSHSWVINVTIVENDPPHISSYYPEQKTVACTVGDTLEFYFTAFDDNPLSLQYSFLMNGVTQSVGSKSFVYRFMERGNFEIEAIVSDGQYSDSVSWDLCVSGFPDTIPPASIVDLQGSPGGETGSIDITWTAPGDDGETGRCAAYIVRTSTYPILTEKDWDEASGKQGEPYPSEAGTTEIMTVANLQPGEYIYVTIRAIDDFFNLSPLGNCIHVRIRGIDIYGEVTDACTGGPLEAIIMSAGVVVDTTGPDGKYLLENVPSYVNYLKAKDEEENYGFTGDYYDSNNPLPRHSPCVNYNLSMIPVLELVGAVEPDPYQGRFLAFFKDITDTDGDLGHPTVHKNWNHWPVTVYNPPKSYEGLDLRAYAREAMVEWMVETGISLFEEVQNPEGADVVISYFDTLDMRHQVVTPEFNEDGTVAKREVWIFLENVEVPIDVYPQLVFAHELGHVLGLLHSRNTGHLMLGLTKPKVSHVTPEEAAAVEVLVRFPPIYDYKYILEE